LNISPVPDDTQSLHTLFSMLVNNVDRRADIHQSIRPEILEGLVQGWLYIVENKDRLDVVVDQERHGVSTDVEDPADERSVGGKRSDHSPGRGDSLTYGGPSVWDS